jgi:hypothetical protein
MGEYPKDSQRDTAALLASQNSICNLAAKATCEKPGCSPCFRLPLGRVVLEHFRNTRRLFEGRARWLFLWKKPLEYVLSVYTNSENAIAHPGSMPPQGCPKVCSSFFFLQLNC